MSENNDLILKGSVKDLGGFSVVRSLPQVIKKMSAHLFSLII